MNSLCKSDVLPLPASTATSVSAPGEWAMAGFDLGNTAYDPAGAPPPRAAFAWSFQTRTPLTASPAVSGGVVYLATGDRRIVALGAASGELHWEVRTSGPVDSAPAVAGATVFVGLRDGLLLALDTASGVERWRFLADGGLVAPPVVASGVVYVGDIEGNMWALDAATGAFRWRTEVDGAFGTRVAVEGPILAAVTLEGRLVLFDAADGRQRFLIPFGGLPTGAAVMDGGEVYVPNSRGAVVAYDPTAGQNRIQRAWRRVRLQLYGWGMTGSPGTPWLLRAWQTRLPRPVGGVAATPDRILAGSEDGTVVAVDRRGQAVLWRRQLQDEHITSRVTVSGDQVLVGTREGVVHSLALADGSPLWSFETGGPVRAAIVVADGRVFIASGDGTLYALR